MDIAVRPVLHDIVDFLASAPTPEDIIAFNASTEESERFEYLVKKTKQGINLSSDEKDELKDYFLLHHMMIIAKGRARKSLGIV
ncbi:MAG: hypothetical protein AAF544_02240 [Bacteroidota bacterium]